MDWRVPVIDEKRFCIVGTMDLTFAECRSLSDRMQGNMVRIPERRLLAIGSFEVEPQADECMIASVRGRHFYKRDADGGEHKMLYVSIDNDGDLTALRRTGRFRDWDADLRNKQ